MISSSKLIPPSRCQPAQIVDSNVAVIKAGDNEVGDSDSEKVEMETRDQKPVKVDTTDLQEQGLDSNMCGFKNRI